MATPPETAVRKMLERRAGDFAMASVPSEAILRRARRRKSRNVMLASAAGLALAALGVLSLSLPRESGRGLGSPATGQLRLVDYSLRPQPQRSNHPHGGTGPVITLDEVRRHGDCMRSQGFDVPEPTEQPGGGWAVILDPARARRLTFGSRRFREAWFVTCGPLGAPLSGDLIIGGPRPKVDRFRSCMSGRGFNLPEPTKDRSGNYDIDEWQFDLTRTSIDTSSPAWNRAMFVVCAPDRI